MRVNFGKFMHFYTMICNFMQKKMSQFGFFLNMPTFNPHLKYPVRKCDQICIFMQRYAILCNNMHCIKMHKNKTNMQSCHKYAIA